MFRKDRMTPEELYLLATRKFARDTLLKTGFTKNILSPMDEVSSLTLENFTLKMEALEASLLAKVDAKRKEQAAQPQKKVLEPEDAAEWLLYVEAYELATFLLIKNNSSSLSPAIKEEFELLTESVEFTDKVIKGEKLSAKYCEQAINLQQKINQHIEVLHDPKKNPELASLRRKQFWLGVGIVVGLTLLAASLFLPPLSFAGCVVLSVGLILSYFAGSITGAMVATFSFSELFTSGREKKTIFERGDRVNRFFQSAKTHAVDAKIACEEDFAPKITQQK